MVEQWKHFALFPARNIARGSYHCISLTRREQDLELSSSFVDNMGIIMISKT